VTTIEAPGEGVGAPVIERPHNAARRRVTAPSRTNFEFWAWLFMRMSGLVLVFLVIGHLIIMNILDGGVSRVNFAFVAGRWSSPFWRLWDLLTLLLAELHGTLGLRTIINDYAHRNQSRFWLKMLLYASAVLVITLGTLVILTFDPTISE
jgi:succinate dehydrogenase / fumarate reductase membrane anchor subunit